jgi:NADH-quinone oxidoreductase subunit J
MIIQGIVFYLFALVVVAAAIMVIASRNPVHSVLFLILAFFNAAGLFVLAGAEFLAMILVVVYVGAVAVMFLFVVMMLDINFTELRRGFLRYLPIGAAIAAILVGELLFVYASGALSPGAAGQAAAPVPADVTNTHALGQLLYTHYLYLFQAAGLILLVAMIGAIVLTHRRRPGVRRQSIPQQLARSAEASIELKKIPSGKGI